MPPVKQADLARALNLSQAAVSRALRNDHRISADTRKRVLAKADELGYRPNIYAAMRSSKAHSSAAELRDCPLVCLHQPNELGHFIIRPPFSQSAACLARERGFSWRTHHLSREEPESLAQTFLAQGVQGIVIGSARGEIGWFEQFPWRYFCAVNAAGRLLDLPIPSIRPDLFHVMLQFYKRAWTCGYRRPAAALFEHSPEHPDDTALRAAFLQSQRKFTGETVADGIFDVPERRKAPREGVRARFQDWIAARQPDALFLFSQEGLDWLKELPDWGGVKAVVSQLPLTEKPGHPDVSEVIPPWGEVAETAVQWLENGIRLRMYGPRAFPAKAYLRCRITGGSLGDPAPDTPGESG